MLIQKVFENNFIFQATAIANVTKQQQLLNNKINIFREETKTNKALHLTMITTKGLKQNNWTINLVQNDLTMDILFKD